MKPHYKRLLDGSLLLKPAPLPPYPQTPATAHAWINAHGIAVTDMARYYQVPRSTLVDLLRGKQKGYRGQAHLGAIVLGLKPEPSKPEGAAA